MSFRLVLFSVMTVFFVMTSASPVVGKDAVPPECGTVDLANGTSQKLYTGACYMLQGKARESHVINTCDCEFFPFETCNARVQPELDDSIQKVKGYYCQKS